MGFNRINYIPLSILQRDWRESSEVSTMGTGIVSRQLPSSLDAIKFQR